MFVVVNLFGFVCVLVIMVSLYYGILLCQEREDVLLSVGIPESSS